MLLVFRHTDSPQQQAVFFTKHANITGKASKAPECGFLPPQADTTDEGINHTALKRYQRNS